MAYLTQPTNLDFLKNRLQHFRKAQPLNGDPLDEGFCERQLDILREHWLRWEPRQLQARYRGYVDKHDGKAVVTMMVPDGNLWWPLHPQSDYSGFGWGYTGTGPETLAYTLLCHALQEIPDEYDNYRDLSLAQVAKRDLVLGLLAGLPQTDHDEPWELTGLFLGEWLVGWIHTHPEELESLVENQIYYLEHFTAHEIRVARQAGQQTEGIHFQS